MTEWLRISVLACAFSATVWAQSGVVKSEGQPIPGATVRATQGERVLTTVTDDSGAFRFDGMTPGGWNVEATMFGFEVGRREVQVAATPTKIDFTLQLRERTRFAGGPRGGGAAAADGLEAGSVAAEDTNPVSSASVPSAPVEGSNESFVVNGSISSGLQTQAGDSRPDFGPGGFGGPGGPNGLDNPGGMTQQGPGAIGGGAPNGPVGGGAGGGFGGPGGGGGFGGPGGGGGFGGGGFGGRGGGGGFAGGRAGAGPGGRGPGARGRGGANGAFIGNRIRGNNARITGSLFYQLGNSALNARPFSVNGIQAPKAAFARNNFGFSAGGPLFFPKLFDFEKFTWFVNYTGGLTRNGVDSAYAEPTLAQRLGDFSQSAKVIYDPATGLPFANNQIPIGRINPIALGLLNYIPKPNQPGNEIQNYRLIASNPNNSHSLNTRLSYAATQKDTVALAFNFQKRDAATYQVFGCCDTSSGKGFNVNLNWRHRFGARSFENLTATFNRNTNLSTPYFFTNGVDVAGQLGIQGASADPRNFGAPSLSFVNFSGLSDGTWTHTAVQSFGLNDTYQLNRGKHNFSFGGGYTRSLNNSVTDPNGRGAFSFSGLSTAGYDANGLPIANTGYDFADFLLSRPETTSVRYGNASTYFRNNSYQFFGQDDYRVSTSFSLNIGLRYEYFGPWAEKYGRIANLDIAPGFAGVSPVLPGQTGAFSGTAYPSSLIQPDRNNFAPRLGIAWKPWPKKNLLVRAGYGWYYNPGQYNQFMSRLSGQPPFAVTNNATTSSANILTLGSGLLTIPVGKTVNNTYAVVLDYRNSYAQTWNFSLQKDLPLHLIGELSYTGTKGTRLDVPQAPNQAMPGAAQTSQQRLPIEDAGNFTLDNPVGNSIYHAGQLRLNRRFQHGFSAQFRYTYAKAIDDAVLAQNFYDQSAERALSANDRRHVVNFTWVYASPVDATKGFLSHPAWAAKALKDWTLSGSITAQTGTPLTPTILGNRAGTGAFTPLRADATGLPIDGGTGYFNLLAFTTPPSGELGNAGRNTITGPGSWILNMSLARSINLHSERRRLEFRLDANNLLNHVNPAGLVTVVGSTQYGLITNAGAMRSLSASLRLRF